MVLNGKKVKHVRETKSVTNSENSSSDIESNRESSSSSESPEVEHKHKQTTKCKMEKEKSETPKSSKSKQHKVSHEDKDKVTGKEDITTSGKVVAGPSAMARLKTSTKVTVRPLETTTLGTVESAGHISLDITQFNDLMSFVR